MSECIMHANTRSQVNNKHQSYFARKAAREAHERKQRQEDAAAAAAESRQMDPAEALRVKREERRRQAGGNGTGAGQDGNKEACAVS